MKIKQRKRTVVIKKIA